jgi:hypothetical protein
LKDKIEKKINNKKDKKKSIRLTCKISNPDHETEITSWKANQNKS